MTDLSRHDLFAINAPPVPEWFEADVSDLGPEPRKPDWDRMRKGVIDSIGNEPEPVPERYMMGITATRARQLSIEQLLAKRTEEAWQTDYLPEMAAYTKYINEKNMLRYEQWAHFYADRMDKA